MDTEIDAYKEGFIDGVCGLEKDAQIGLLLKSILKIPWYAVKTIPGLYRGVRAISGAEGSLSRSIINASAALPGKGARAVVRFTKAHPVLGMAGAIGTTSGLGHLNRRITDEYNTVKGVPSDASDSIEAGKRWNPNGNLL